MKWNIDNELARLEPEQAAGTSITRCYMDLVVMQREKIVPTADQRERQGGLVWCLAIGVLGMPKAFFYGQTILEAYLRARRNAKKGKGHLMGVWNTPVKVKGYGRAKKRLRKAAKKVRKEEKP